ncbi:MAG: HEAT repeat domain-containing protein, partial [Verrucomicrobiae bacterium]|nr:HEAT repeat domain-containing protein [Verrucomicrobiae bacterium]
LDAEGILSNPDVKPIVWRGYKDPFEQFDYRAYPKGSWVLHMLRSQLGPELFRKCITTYIERNRNRNVVTHDLIAVFEELTGRSWDEFFDQWVFHGGEPALKVAYAWDQARGQVKLSVQQTQKTSEQVLLFDFPLPVRFVDETGANHDFTVRIHETTEDFYFDLPGKPRIARIDPDLTVLASVDFTPPNSMLHAQLEEKTDMMGRLLAVRTLGGRDDGQSIDLLKKRLDEDAFYGVRIEAARSLAKTHTPESLVVLMESAKQDDARVRGAVAESIGKFYSEAAFAKLKELAESEANPDITADLVSALGKFPADQSKPVLVKALARESYRNRIASSAIQALREQGESASASLVVEQLQKNEAKFTSWDFGRGLDSLAYLARHQTDGDREKTRQFIAGYLDHPKETLRRAAIGALGTLEDPRSLGALQTFVDADHPDVPESKAAEAAIKKLNSEKGQADEVKDLRKEVMELQKALKQLQDGLETVKKQTEPEPAENKEDAKAN